MAPPELQAAAGDEGSSLVLLVRFVLFAKSIRSSIHLFVFFIFLFVSANG